VEEKEAAKQTISYPYGSERRARP